MAFLTLTVFWEPSLNLFLDGQGEKERPRHGFRQFVYIIQKQGEVTI